MARKSTGIPIGNWTGQRILRNGGGFVTQFDIAPDGTMVIGCDIHACYFKRPTDTEWQPILTWSQMPAGDIDPSLQNGNFADSTGCFAIAIAASNSDRVYFCYNGRLYRFSISTKTAVRTAFVQQTLICNTGSQRGEADKLIVDNQNPSAFLFGTLQGVYYSTNDGTTVTSLSAPACDTDPGNNAGGGPYPYPHHVAIDPTSPVVSGLRQRCYYSVRAAGAAGGVYESTTGPGGPYPLISGSPNGVSFMRFGASGKLWVNDSAGNMWWYTKTAGAFTKITTPITGLIALAEDPANAAHLFAIDGAGNACQSLDTGATWQNLPANTSQLSLATTQAYLRVPGLTNYWVGSSAGIRFNPAGSGELWRNWGYGISKAAVPASIITPPIRWFEQNKGIDEANCTSILCPPGGSPVAAFFDLGTWRLDDFLNCNNRPKVPQKAGDTWDLTPPFINQPSNAIGFAKDNPNWIATLTCNGFFGSQPFVVGSVASPTVTAGNVLSVTLNGTTTNVTLSGTTLASTISDINSANILGLIASDDGASHLQLVSTANYPFTLTGTPLTALGMSTVNTPSGPKGNPHNGFSTDGGKTWSLFPTNIPGEPSFAGCSFGGCLEVGKQGHMIVLWQSKRSPRYSEDGGATWPVLPIPGLTADGVENGFGDWSNGFFSKKNICFDGSNWYAYSYGAPSAPTQNGIWKAPKPSGPWTQIWQGSFTNGQYNSRLRPVPGKAGQLFFTAGSGAPSAVAMSRVVDNLDGTMTVTNIANTSFITDVGMSYFPGATFPAVLVFGIVNGVGGYHISYDNCATWTNLGYLGDWADWPKIITGEINEFGFLAGMNGSGVMRVTIDEQLKLAA